MGIKGAPRYEKTLTCPKGHPKEGVRFQRRKQKSGRVIGFKVSFCKICNRASTQAASRGYLQVRVSKMLLGDVRAESEGAGKTIYQTVTALLVEALAGRRKRG